MLSPEEVQSYRQQYGIGQPSATPTPSVASPEDRIARLRQRAQIVDQVQPASQPEQPGFVQSVAQDVASPFLRMATNVRNAYGVVTGEQGAQTKERDFGYLGKAKPIGQGDSFVHNVADAVGVGTQIAGTVLGGEGAGAIVKDTLKGAIKSGLKTGAMEGAVSGASYSGGSELQNPNATPLSVAGQTALGAVVGGVGGAAAGATAPLPAAAIKAVFPTEKGVQNALTDTYTKAVKPTISGQGTEQATKQYQAKTIQAVQSIVENKPNLKFTTEEGDQVGRLPQSLREFSDAIDQTKKSVYQQYDALAQRAGKGGATVDLSAMGNSLDTVINNKALQLSHPEAISYAQALKDRFVKAGALDTKTTQDLIQNYNNSLEAFYHNPTYDNASRAAIDAGVVNNLRTELDKVIEGATGSEYQALKNKYGALKTIEKDVTKRANVDARKNAKGLIDYADIFSGGDMVSGILSMNPALFAKGAAQKSITEYIKHLNNPNTAIKSLFQQAEKHSGYLQRPVKSLTTSSAAMPKNTPSATAAANAKKPIASVLPQTTKSASNAAFGGIAGFRVDDKGSVSFDPTSAGLGIAGMAMSNKKRILNEKLSELVKVMSRTTNKITRGQYMKAVRLVKNEIGKLPE